MRTECPIDMKQTVLEREFYKLSFYAKKKKKKKRKEKKKKNLILTSFQFCLVSS